MAPIAKAQETSRWLYNLTKLYSIPKLPIRALEQSSLFTPYKHVHSALPGTKGRTQASLYGESLSRIHRPQQYLPAELGPALHRFHTHSAEPPGPNYSQRSVSIVRDMVGWIIPASALRCYGCVQALRNLNKTVEKCTSERGW